MDNRTFVTHARDNTTIPSLPLPHRRPHGPLRPSRTGGTPAEPESRFSLGVDRGLRREARAGRNFPLRLRRAVRPGLSAQVLRIPADGFPARAVHGGRETVPELAALGARLTALHLLTSPELDPPACRFQGQGDSRIGKGNSAGLRYDAGRQRVHVNATQYFAPVAEAVWSYQGGRLPGLREVAERPSGTAP